MDGKDRREAGCEDRPTVLIVDDEPINLELLARVLGDAYRILIARSGEQALAIIARGPLPDVILLDITMPGITGYEVLETLQGDPQTQVIPVIFITALSDWEEEADGLARGAVDYITKPFNSAVVRARVGTHAKLKARSDQLAAQHRQLQVQQRQIEAELRVASRVQQSLLPDPPPVDVGYTLDWYFQPSAVLGGDVFGAIPLDDGRVVLYMLDVSGHGVAAALVSVSVAQSIRQWVAERRQVSPAAILDALDEAFPLERFDKFFTLMVVIYDPAAGEIRYSNAGHPPGLLIRERGGSLPLQAGGLPVGVGGWGGYEEGRLAVAEGDLLFLYTDGLVDVEDAAGCPLSAETLERALRDWRGCSVDTVIQGVRRMMEDHADQPPSDDVTFACLRFLGAGQQGGSTKE
ncbi:MULTISPECIES: PP2C family protein-serine/threonine phosphatase [Halorhodospira]|uniref:PP2C family protein-serine/threonine phosphatase n=2 Tax=Ectothiorhodospiraceae TaxID=72276 RepID=UPI001EE97D4A|nr:MULTISPECIES: fused response regulator/phosphatase [Halorhodospira]MCG5528966.1 fused response regulator/phosphatase [Halorhodospira halophila]MCG5544064.1 fused response regulator/phosphatase [Halorhodospira sp. 9628]